MEYNGINIELSRDSLLTDFGKKTLEDRYLLPEEDSPQKAFARAAISFSDDLDMAQRIYDYASQLWFMYSTPILSNGGTEKGLPISCFLNHVPDSREGISSHYDENIWLASNGGGIGGGWSSLRTDGVGTSGGSASNGMFPFVKVVDSLTLAVSQGRTRRGSYAAYLNISHPEIELFIDMRKPTGGDANLKCLNIHHGVNISDAFMEAVKAGLEWNLIDPHTKDVISIVDSRSLWMKILTTRVETGEPYLHFIDESNRKLPECQKKLGLEIRQSNLCSEIILPTDEQRTAVCCLSSVNIEKYDAWKNHPTFIADLVRFLDNVLDGFIDRGVKHGKGLQRAVYSAMQERSIGIGAMGFHSFLQAKNVAFESAVAKSYNNQIFELLRRKAEAASVELGKERGFAPDCLDSGAFQKRNVHLLAVAPNASSSIICGTTSPSIEPYTSNAYVQKTLSGSFKVINPNLTKLLQEKEKDTEEIWSSILTNGGSVQYLDFLSDHEKDVYKTAFEIDQMWIIEHASDRQKFIDQSQSVNLFFPTGSHVEYLHKVHWKAWEKKMKTLYYVRSGALRKAEKVGQYTTKDDGSCLACE